MVRLPSPPLFWYDNYLLSDAVLEHNKTEGTVVKMDFLLDEDKKQDLFDVIEKDLYKDRVINLTDSVSSYIIDSVVGMIQHINLEDDKKSVLVSERKPIKLYINSYGGSVYDGWSIVSAIVNSKTPIYTYVEGYAMSMGLALFMAGRKRFISKYATLMYHELSSRLEGSREEIRRATEEYDRLQDMYDDFIIERSGLTKDELKDHHSKVSDWFISSKVAIEKKLATDII